MTKYYEIEEDVLTFDCTEPMEEEDEKESGNVVELFPEPVV